MEEIYLFILNNLKFIMIQITEKCITFVVDFNGDTENCDGRITIGVEPTIKLTKLDNCLLK